jgi:hypothetical protein
MSHEALSNVMFWVGAMFALTPLLVVGTIFGSIWFLRKRRKTPGTQTRT